MKYAGFSFGWSLAAGLLVAAIMLYGFVRLAAAQGATQFMPFVGRASLTLPPATLGWNHLSTATGDLPSTDAGPEQVAALVGDLDGDGRNDFVIAARRGQGEPSVVWYQRGATGGWTRRVVEPSTLPLEAGGALYDIDQDGDLDLVLGANRQDNAIWWWENPAPAYNDDGWTRRTIKDSGQSQHHDMMFGEFDGDAAIEFVYWTQGAARLYVVEVPPSPRTTEPWPGARPIFTAPSTAYEGLAQGDVDGDGRTDIVAGGYWLSHLGGDSYRANPIAPTTNARVAIGQLKAGGRPEIVITPGDATGMARWYEWNGSGWTANDLLSEEVFFTHSLELGDVDGDGALDIFMGEMAFHETDERHNIDAQSWIFYGDGQGGFETRVATHGFGHHESRLADLDGDGDLDILGKPFLWDTPRLDIWLNSMDGEPPVCEPLDIWMPHLIDDDRPARAVFIATADLDGDSRPDVVSGAWWYRNPGMPGGVWSRSEIGAPLNQMAVVADLDNDGDNDILGTVQSGPQPQHGQAFVWARNDGAGNFTVSGVVATGSGDFLQGAVVADFGRGQQVALSWHNGGDGIEVLTVPADPVAGPWPSDALSPISEREALSAGDIDGDGDTDLLLGGVWLESGPNDWEAHTLFSPNQPADRNHLADMDGDGDLDAVIGFEGISVARPVTWYEQPDDPTALWPEHVIGSVIGPQSLDVGDLDGDGDVDVVVGEHNLSDPTAGRVLIFENGAGSWQQRVVATGHEHHDGTQLFDSDGDGDLDIVSIGWGHGHVLLYEQIGCQGHPDVTPTAIPWPTVR